MGMDLISTFYAPQRGDRGDLPVILLYSDSSLCGGWARASTRPVQISIKGWDLHIPSARLHRVVIA